MHVVIVGGGAAGMMAAIAAAESGAQVTVLERNPRVGKKLLMTGNGRCNYTNTHASDPAHYHGLDTAGIEAVLSSMTVDKLIDLFSRLGISPLIEEEDRVYPRSEQAASVLDALRFALDDLGVSVLCDTEVQGLIRSGNSWRIECRESRPLEADRVILAAGGKAVPNTGSDGSGYVLACGAGHSLRTPFPALTQLKLEGDFYPRLKGVKWKGSARLVSGQKRSEILYGDLLFTDYGISGPPILDLSGHVSEWTEAGLFPSVEVSLFPDLTAGDIADDLINRSVNLPERPLQEGLVGLVNKRLILVLLALEGLDKHMPMKQVREGQWRALAKRMTQWTLPVKGARSWPNAQASGGGILLSEVDPASMESRVAQGLYLAGELLDVYGDCGGYNLHWAWLTGRLAGLAASQENQV
mgnify:CR=1 FL=1